MDRKKLENKYQDLTGFLRQIYDKKIPRPRDESLINRLVAFYRQKVTPAAEKLVIELAKKNRSVFSSPDFRTREGKEAILNEVYEFWKHRYLIHQGGILNTVKAFIDQRQQTALYETLEKYEKSSSLVAIAQEFINFETMQTIDDAHLGPEDNENASAGDGQVEESDGSESIGGVSGKDTLKQIARNTMGSLGAATLGAVYTKGGTLTKGAVTAGMGLFNAARPVGSWLKSRFSGVPGAAGKISPSKIAKTTGHDFTPREEKIEGDRERGKVLSVLEQIEENTRDGANGQQETKGGISALSALLGGVPKLLMTLSPILGGLAAVFGATAVVPGVLSKAGGAEALAKSAQAARNTTSIRPNPARVAATPSGAPASAAGPAGAGSRLSNIWSKTKTNAGSLLSKGAQLGQGALNTTGNVLTKAGKFLAPVAMARDAWNVGSAIHGGDGKEIAETVGGVGGGWGTVAAASPIIAKATLAAAAIPVVGVVAAPVVGLGLSAAAYYGGSKAGGLVGGGIGSLMGADELEDAKKSFVRGTKNGETVSGTGVLVRTLESGSAGGNYGEINPSDRGKKSYGAYQFRDAKDGALQPFLKYLSSNEQYRPLAQKLREATPSSPEFDKIWKSLSDDPSFKEAQDTFWNNNYRIPALKYAKEYGVKSNPILDEIIASSFTSGPKLTEKAIRTAAETKDFAKLDVKDQGALIIAELNKMQGKTQFTPDRLAKQQKYFQDNIDTFKETVNASGVSTSSSIKESTSATISAPGGQELAAQMAGGVQMESSSASWINKMMGTKTPANIQPYSSSKMKATSMAPEKQTSKAAPTVIAPSSSTVNNFNQLGSSKTPASPYDPSPNVRRLQDMNF